MIDEALSQLDDFRVLSGSDLPETAPTIFAILRNEMYFLEAFLDHYRALGIERFVLLDDRSDDGSRELLLAQPDVTLLASDRRYGDRLALPGTLSDRINEGRILFVWRALLHKRFSPGRWAAQVDLDEFIELPPGRRFGDIFAELDAAPFDAVWGAMLDAYPADLEELSARRGTSRLDCKEAWYFDAQPHLQLRAGRRPRALHPGARARLYHTYGATRLYPELGIKTDKNPLRRIIRTHILGRPPPYNLVRKPVLVRWRPGAIFVSSHETSLPSSDAHLLPMVHYRFAGSIYEKIERALAEKSYSSGSRDHRLLAETLAEMARVRGSFRYRRSREVAGWDTFAESGNAFGFSIAVRDGR